MDLYKLNNSKLETLKRDSYELEKDIQSLVEKNVEEIFDIEFVKSEMSLDSFRLDSLCFDNNSNSFVIIEYKKERNFSVIDQGYSYLSLMLNNKSEFILEYNESMGRSLKREDIDWSQSRVIFISPSFTHYQKNSVNFKDVPFELWEIKKFSNDIVGFNQLKSTSNQSIELKGKKGNNVISNINKEVKVLSEEDVISINNSNKSLIKLFYKIKDRVIDWDDIQFGYTPTYISFKRKNKTFVFINFRKKYLRVHILSGIKIGWDGKVLENSNLFTLDDQKKMFNKVESKYKILYSLDITDDNKLDYFVEMIKQKYESVG
jgi:predicted transport protein